MNQFIDNDVVTLITIALGFSKKSGAVITIKYGDVILQYCEICAAIRLSNDVDKFQVVWSLEHDGIYVIFIPMRFLLNIDRIFALLAVLFDVKLHPDDMIFISIPENYYKKMSRNKKIYLDRFFCLTTKDCDGIFKCLDVKGQHFFEIDCKGMIKSSYPVYFAMRNGDGNEDL